MKKRTLKRTAVLLNESFNDVNNDLHNEWYLMLLDINNYKILKQTPSVKKEDTTKNICKISFDDKTIEKINLSRIFCDPLVKVIL